MAKKCCADSVNNGKGGLSSVPGTVWPIHGLSSVHLFHPCEVRGGRHIILRIITVCYEIASRFEHFQLSQPASKMHVLKIVSALIAMFLVLTVAGYIVEPVRLKSAPYSPWAHAHWIWSNAHVQNQTNLLQLLHDYLDRDVPVGAINIDSGWSTCYNDFIVDTFVYSQN